MQKMMSLLLLLIISLACISQMKKNIKIGQDSIIKKWTAATFCVEVELPRPPIAIPTEATFDRATQIVDSVEALMVRTRSSGTAIFLEYNSRYYMITARHVVCKDTQSVEMIDKVLLSVNKDTGNFNPPLSGWAFIKHPGFPNSTKYILSKENDLAIVHLGAPPNYQTFLKGLQIFDYTAIKVSDIDTSFVLKVGDSIMAIGYPKESVYENIKVSPGYEKWMPNKLRIPIVTTGRMISANKKSSFFEGDIFVYHGNSGGPVIHNNKLVGITHAIGYTRYAVEKGASKSYYRLFPIFIKSSEIFKLLEKLESQVIAQELQLGIK